MMLDVLLYSGNIWLIIGLLLAILELTNGSLIFFLPTGASGMITGLILKLQENESLPILLLLASTKLPSSAPSVSSLPPLILAKGPILQFFPITLSSNTVLA